MFPAVSHHIIKCVIFTSFITMIKCEGWFKKWLKSDKNCHIIWSACCGGRGHNLNFTVLCSEMEGLVDMNIQKQQASLSLPKAQLNPKPSYYEVTEQVTASCSLKLLRFGGIKGQGRITKEDQRVYTQPSSMCCCRHAALASCNSSSWLRRLPLCYSRMRKQEGTMLGVRKGVRKGCQRLCSAQILSVPEPILCDWCHTSPQQFVLRRCRTYWASGGNNTTSHAPYLQYSSGTQEALLFHCDTRAFCSSKEQKLSLLQDKQWHHYYTKLNQDTVSNLQQLQA